MGVIKKILVVFGTRPEAIKMAPVVKELERQSSHFEIRVCVTAQHREMLDQVLRIFEIKPDYDLNIMKPNQDLFDITNLIMTKIKAVLTEYKPDVVLIHGDTTTALAVSLSCFYLHIPVGHVEAGLRTYNLQAPWPEEMNRQLADRVCTYHFCPTSANKANLRRERLSTHHAIVTGNTVIDALQWVVEKIRRQPELEKDILDKIHRLGYRRLHTVSKKAPSHKFILVTGHRRENFGDGFVSICSALKTVATAHPEVDIVYPVHLNPNVQEPVRALLGTTPNIALMEPLDYLPFVYLMSRATLILTDSGGIQEEAPSLGKPVLVMRETTERPEGVKAGTVKLVGTDTDKIVHAVHQLLTDSGAYEKMTKAHNPYGNGKASQKIVRFLRKI